MDLHMRLTGDKIVKAVAFRPQRVDSSTRCHFALLDGCHGMVKVSPCLRPNTRHCNCRAFPATLIDDYFRLIDQNAMQRIGGALDMRDQQDVAAWWRLLQQKIETLRMVCRQLAQRGWIEIAVHAQRPRPQQLGSLPGSTSLRNLYRRDRNAEHLDSRSDLPCLGPCTTYSSTPCKRVTIAGTPAAIACMTTNPNVSYMEGSTNRSDTQK